MTDQQKDENTVKILEVPIEYLVPFKNNPFQVKSDYQMVELKESIARNGILTHLILRPTKEDMLKIISGHRRKHAADLIGLETVPTIIKNLDYEEAIVEIGDKKTNYAKDVMEAVRQTYKDIHPIYECVIPISIRAAEYSAEGINIYTHANNYKVSGACKELTKEVLNNEKKS